MAYSNHDGTPAGVLRFWAERAEDDARQHYAAAEAAFQRGARDFGEAYQRIAVAAARRADSIRAELAALTGQKEAA